MARVQGLVLGVCERYLGLLKKRCKIGSYNGVRWDLIPCTGLYKHSGKLTRAELRGRLRQGSHGVHGSHGGHGSHGAHASRSGPAEQAETPARSPGKR